MGMEDLALLGGVAAIMVFGYVMAARLDCFLDKVRKERRGQAQTACLNVATSCLDAIPAVSNILKDIRHLDPDVHCRLSVGCEQEVIQSLVRGEADVAIVSADSRAESETLAQWDCVTLAPQSFSADHGIVEVKTIGRKPQHQKILWKSGENPALVRSFLHRLWGQGP